MVSHDGRSPKNIRSTWPSLVAAGPCWYSGGEGRRSSPEQSGGASNSDKVCGTARSGLPSLLVSAARELNATPCPTASSMGRLDAGRAQEARRLRARDGAAADRGVPDRWQTAASGHMRMASSHGYLELSRQVAFPGVSPTRYRDARNQNHNSTVVIRARRPLQERCSQTARLLSNERQRGLRAALCRVPERRGETRGTDA